MFTTKTVTLSITLDTPDAGGHTRYTIAPLCERATQQEAFHLLGAYLEAQASAAPEPVQEVADAEQLPIAPPQQEQPPE